MSEAGEGPAPQWFPDPDSLLAALYLYTPGARPFALSRPDALSPLPTSPVHQLCPHTPTHDPDDMGIPSLAVFADRAGAFGLRPLS
jgi:hypothetical protein